MPESDGQNIPPQDHHATVVKVKPGKVPRPIHKQRGVSVASALSYMARPYHAVMIEPYEGVGVKIYHDDDGFGTFVWPSPKTTGVEEDHSEELSIAICRVFMVDFSPCCDANCYMEGDGATTHFVCAKCGKTVDPIRKMVRRPSYGKGAGGRRTMNWPWVRIPWKDVPKLIEAIQKVYDQPGAVKAQLDMRELHEETKAVKSLSPDEEMWEKMGGYI